MSEAAHPIGGSPPRRTKGAATRARLMAAASRLFAEQGYDGTSVEAIATAAGITVPGMYRHFPNKAAVLLEVFRHATVTSAARRALVGGPDLPARLGGLFAEYTATDQVERRRLSIELSRASYQNPDLRHALTEYNAVLRASLRDTIAAARPALADAGDEADLLAHLLLVLLMGAIHLDTLDADLIGDQDLVALLVERFAVVLDGPTRGLPAGRGRPSMGSIRVEHVSDHEPSDGRRRRTVRTRRRILDAAAELFALHGFDGTTIEMIAVKAGITVPGIYLHVTSKEALLVEVARRELASYRVAGPLGSTGDAVADLAAWACAFSKESDQVARRLAIELDFGAWRTPTLAAGLRKFHRSTRSNLAESLASVHGPGHDPERSALIYLMLFMGIAHLDTVDPSLVGNRRWCEFLRRRLPQLIAPTDGHARNDQKTV